MAVEIKYVVIREGVEKMSFASKKEADAWDKMLDLAEALEGWLQQAPVSLEEGQAEQLALWMAEHKESLNTIVRTGRLPQEKVENNSSAGNATAADTDRPQEKENAVTPHPGSKRTKAA